MSLRGHLLVAPAHMADPSFAHAVVLLLQHDGSGAFGVILNRPTSESICDVWTRVTGAPCKARGSVHEGGPVPGPLVALHGEGDLGELEVLPGVWCSMSGDRIADLVERDPQALLLFAGYSGWGAGQLEGEMQAGAWLSVEARREDIFPRTTEGLWASVHRRAADVDPFAEFERGAAGPDPRWN
ncbi:MAG: YqgE/AlgH family protein [Planctomycetota bacterium]